MGKQLWQKIQTRAEMHEHKPHGSSRRVENLNYEELLEAQCEQVLRIKTPR